MRQSTRDKAAVARHKAAFIEALAECGVVARAAKAADISRWCPYEWRKHDPEFAAAWEEAQKLGNLSIVDEMYRRGHDGIDKPVIYQGRFAQDEHGNPLFYKEYSDTLLIVLAKMRGLFVEKSEHALTGRGGGPIRSENTTRVAGLSDEELLELAGEGAAE